MYDANGIETLKPATTPDSIPQPMSKNSPTGPVDQNAQIFHAGKKRSRTTVDVKLPPDEDQENTVVVQSNADAENAPAMKNKPIEKRETLPHAAPKTIDSTSATLDQSPLESHAIPNNELVSPDIRNDKPVQNEKFELKSFGKKDDSGDVGADHQKKVTIEDTDILSPDDPVGNIVPEKDSRRERPVPAETESKLSKEQKQIQLSPALQLRPPITLGANMGDSPAYPEPTEETVVTINIGRIEVRTAATTDAKPSMRKEYHPSLSLAEYLKQRSGAKT